MENLYELLQQFATNAKVNIEYVYDTLIIADSKYSELEKGLLFTESKENIISGMKIIKKSEADKFIDLSQHWKCDDNIFLINMSNFHICRK